VALCGTFTAGQWLIGDLPVIPALVPADVVLIDHYELNPPTLPSLTVSMEDGEYGRRRADIVVDANVYTTPRPDDGSPVVLRGPAYAPLRAEIRAARQARTAGSTPPKVVVVMGGGAAPSSVAAAVTALQATGVPAEVVAISSVPVPGVDVISPTPKLPELFASADLVVSAAGVTLLELCCVGVPAALVQIADNQAAGYQAAVSQGLTAGLGTDPRDHVDVLRHLLLDENARKALGQKAMAAVDGQGAERILNAIETQLRDSPERLRNATKPRPFEGLDQLRNAVEAQPLDAPDQVHNAIEAQPREGLDRVGDATEAQLREGLDRVGDATEAQPPEGPDRVRDGVKARPQESPGRVGNTTEARPRANPDRLPNATGTQLDESPVHRAGGPPISSLAATTDKTGGLTTPTDPSRGSHPEVRGLRPPVSTLPEGTDISVRPAGIEDSATLLAWRNDPETRAWSRTTDPVTAEDHEAWLDRTLANPDRRLLIAEQHLEPVGTIRFDRDGDHWEVSITVAPRARGRKLAVPMLLAAEREIRGTIRACVHQDNKASLALFDRADYRRDNTVGPWVWFAKSV
jgi:spore coat polysaccharide biosynthesis predicted glycosyltransferase SpsG/RimJ/RimL family protein N-acetyltransferase